MSRGPWGFVGGGLFDEDTMCVTCLLYLFTSYAVLPWDAGPLTGPRLGGVTQAEIR